MSEVKEVRIDGSVLLKIIRHCDVEESNGRLMDVIGNLYGLPRDDFLEITSCYPIASLQGYTEDEAVQSETLREIETDLVKHMRQVNLDYLNVGVYQVAFGGSFFTRTTIENLCSYEGLLYESVLLIYDASKTVCGQISLKAYRVTPELFEMSREILRENDAVLKEAFHSLKLDYKNLLKEIPVVIRNSHLCKILIADLKDHIPERNSTERFAGLSMASADSIEAQLRQCSFGLDEMCTDLQKTCQVKRMLNRAMDTNKPIERQMPPRLESALTSSQMDTLNINLASMVKQLLGKLELVKAIQENPTEKEDA